MRAFLRPVSQTAHASMRAPVAKATFQPLAALSSTRAFAAKAAPLTEYPKSNLAFVKPKVEDGTLEGRYATALFMAAPERLDKVYADLMNFREMMNESKDLKLLVQTPGIDPRSKVAALKGVCSSAGIDDAVFNFMQVLVENKRLKLLPKMIELFEVFYRAEKGLIPCLVTSATDLGKAEKKKVEAAMAKRAGAGATLIMEYSTEPRIMGGLVVKMGEAVYDYSVSNRLTRMEMQLLAPLAD